jgi:hypothetical protein
MSQPPEGAQLSEDGYYWWDGSQWQLVDQSGDGAAASDQAAMSGPSPDEPFPADQFPEIGRVLQYGNDVDAYLTDIGVDPSVITDTDDIA